MRLKLDARGRRLLRRLPVVNVYTAAELVLMAALAMQVARFAWVLATPVSPLGDWRPATPVLGADARDILSGFDPFFRLDQQAQTSTVTPLQLVLYGTRINEAMGRGSAIIAGADGLQRSISVGDEIQPGVRLKAVAFDHVTLERGGVDEDLFIDQSGANADAGGPAGLPGPGADGASSGSIDPAASSGETRGIGLAQLQSDIGFIPRLDGGRISGLAVRSQGTGTAFREIGLREGDVITAIAGQPVASATDLQRIVTQYGGGGNIPITVERGKQTLGLSLTIAPN